MSLPGEPIAGSFRDPSGFVFIREGTLYRQVNDRYRDHFDCLIATGLYDELARDGLLVEHETADLALALTDEAIAVLRPTRLPMISYPYEWSFGQLKDAAVLTLEIQRRALAKGMTLKDASAYNIQFVGGKPIHIDTLSFEVRSKGQPWIAYKQFCQHFLAPLALMAFVDVRLGNLLRSYIDGIPLDLASRLLPTSTKLKPGLLAHIHMHASAQSRSAGEKPSRQAEIGETGLIALVDNLRGTIEKLDWKATGTEWADYYDNTNYTSEAMDAKKALVGEMLDQIGQFGSCWDLGGNTGEFSALAAARGANTVSWDVDPAAVEISYRRVRGEEGLLTPLLLDLTNPSPSLGWASKERESFIDRGPVDVLLALALIHHLAIGNNVPLPEVARLFASIGKWALIEFVPKSDSQVKRMLVSREDIFDHYDEDGFVAAFEPLFEFVARHAIPRTERCLYLLKRRDA